MNPRNWTILTYIVIAILVALVVFCYAKPVRAQSHHDTFTGPAGTPILQHSPEEGGYIKWADVQTMAISSVGTLRGPGSVLIKDVLEGTPAWAEFTIRRYRTGANELGFYLSVSNDGAHTAWYSGSHWYFLTEFDGTRIQDIVPGFSIPLTTGGSHRVRFERSGGQIRFFVNGNQVRSWPDQLGKPGRVGLYMYDNALEIDDLRAGGTAPPPPPFANAKSHTIFHGDWQITATVSNDQIALLAPGHSEIVSRDLAAMSSSTLAAETMGLFNDLAERLGETVSWPVMASDTVQVVIDELATALEGANTIAEEYRNTLESMQDTVMQMENALFSANERADSAEARVEELEILVADLRQQVEQGGGDPALVAQLQARILELEGQRTALIQAIRNAIDTLRAWSLTVRFHPNSQVTQQHLTQLTNQLSSVVD